VQIWELPVKLLLPNPIPDAIIEAKIEHTKPYPGDHGIQYTPGRNVSMKRDKYAR
jgi:hypothetical protein